ncbi:hypothetical protein [Rubellimicrobium mesophilum]|uniref:hypothetical protein n=1 Tax=Rubellimicrobium mesophilum TaxID=1123067 RepID=UPI001B80A39A|nr:hypothetical protein [Rubellimicrobium mesophilum]
MSTEAESEAMAAVYAARDAEELRAGYAAWAETYDAETAASGYRLPHLVAMLVARHVPREAGECWTRAAERGSGATCCTRWAIGGSSGSTCRSR